MALTWTQQNKLSINLGIGHSGLSDRATPSTSLLYSVFAEHKTNANAVDVRVTAVEALLANAKVCDDLAGLRLLDTTDFEDGQLVTQEDTGALYRFNLGETPGSEDPPSTVDATDGGGTYHETVAQDLGIHTPVTSIANLKGITAGNRTDNMICLVKANGAGMADLYRFVAGDATVESLPEVVAPSAGTGRWFAIGTGDLKTYNDTLYDAIGAAAAILTADELAAINGAAAPAAGNVFATMGDIPADELTADELASINANAGLDAANAVQGANEVAAAIAADPTSLGSAACVTGKLSGNFTDGDTIEVAGVTFQALAVPLVATDFEIGVDHDASLANLAAVVMGGAGGASPNVNVYAMGGGSGVVVAIRSAAPNGAIQTGDPGSLAFTVSITGPDTFVWDFADMQNASWRAATKLMSHGGFEFDATSAAVAAAGFAVIGSFGPGMSDPSMFTFSVQDSSGVPKACDDVIEYSTDGYIFVEGQGGANPIANGDVINWIALE
jgi:hypothetical protein